MTVKDPDRVALEHGKITEQPIREKKPAVPSWAIKLCMAITGLLFALFVFVHMIGNLKMFLPMEVIDGQAVRPMNVYAEFLRSVGEPLFPREGVLWILRIVLLVAIVLHIYGGVQLFKRGRESRGQFKRTNLMGGWNSFATKTMIVSGVLLLLFIIFHLLDLTLGTPGAASSSFQPEAVNQVTGEHVSFAYENLVNSFSRWPVALVYIVAMFVLFAHLTHGIWLATSDLGISGRKWRAVMQFVAYALPALVMIGNILIPVAVLLGWVTV